MMTREQAAALTHRDLNDIAAEFGIPLSERPAFITAVTLVFYDLMAHAKLAARSAVEPRGTGE